MTDLRAFLAAASVDAAVMALRPHYRALLVAEAGLPISPTPRGSGGSTAGHRIVVADIRATYGDGRPPALAGASHITDDTPREDAGRAAVVAEDNEELA